MAQMTAVQVSGPGGAFETVNRQVPEPGPHSVRIRIQACGVCHSDVFVKEGHWPGLQYPRVTGHEVAGVIDAVGPGVMIWKKGQRVGVGWRWTLRTMCLLSPWGFHGLSELPSHGVSGRRRVRPIHDCPERSRSRNSRRSLVSGGSAHPLRRRHDLQQLAS